MDPWSQATAPKTPEQTPKLPSLDLVSEDEPRGGAGIVLGSSQRRRTGKDDPVQEFLVRMVNLRLKGDKALSECLPLRPESEDILEAVAQGVLPWQVCINTSTTTATAPAAAAAPPVATNSDRNSWFAFCLFGTTGTTLHYTTRSLQSSLCQPGAAHNNNVAYIPGLLGTALHAAGRG